MDLLQYVDYYSVLYWVICGTWDCAGWSLQKTCSSHFTV